MTPLGPTPWLPGALGAFFAAPIPAARLYMLRVGVMALVLFDIIFLYAADFSALYGEAGYTKPAVSLPHFQPHRAIWSLVLEPDTQKRWIILGLWAFACIGALLNFRPRACLVVAWACSVSFLYANPDMHTGGDRLRNILLFTLIFSPLPSRQDVRAGRLACGWPAKFLLFQLAIMYFFAGAYKLRHPGWQDGLAMYFVLNNSSWCLAPGFIQGDFGLLVSKVLSWGTIAWEMLFPILVLIPWTRRRIALGLGVVFHLLCLVGLQTSTFPLYSLACYLPLVPWERIRRK